MTGLYPHQVFSKNMRIREPLEKQPLPDGVKWSNLEHNGVLFPPDYVQHHKEFRYRSVCHTLKHSGP